MNTSHAGLAALALLCCSLSPVALSEATAQTKLIETPEAQAIKVRTELMEVPAVVTDPKGRIVENLSQDDFELLENDQQQTISFFSVSRAGGEHVSTGGEAKVPENTPVDMRERIGALQRARERLTEQPVRTTLLYVDNLHLSFSSLNRVKDALRVFVKEKLTEQDMVALATSSQSLGIAQQFSRDRQLLNYAIEQIRPGPTKHHGGLFSTTLAAQVLGEKIEAVRLAVDIMRREGNMDCCNSLRMHAQNEAMQTLNDDTYSRSVSLSILRDFAEQMIRLPGKRMIVVFSDGFTLYDTSTNIHYSEVQAAIDRAVRSGVVIYSINAKGLHAPANFDAARKGPTNPDDHPEVTDLSEQNPNLICREDMGPPDQRCFAPSPGLLDRFMSLSEREEINGLSMMADQTGGKLFENTQNIGAALGQAFDENRFYYVLSYYLKPTDKDHNFRTIKVRVRNHPEYKVRSPKRFSPFDVAASDEDESKTPQQRLLKAMNAPLPVTDIGVSAQAEFVETENDERQVSLTVYFDGDRLQYQEKDQNNVFGLEILYVIYDSTGKQVEGISARVDGTLSKDRVTQAKKTGYRFSRRLTLKPGLYQARIGVRQEGTDRIGTATTWVEVPAVTGDRLAMSSLILRNPLDADTTVAEGINVSSLEQIRMVQGIPLYAPGDFCDYTFRVHKGIQNANNPEFAVLKELYQDGKSIRQEAWKAIQAEDVEVDKKGWFDVDGEVDLSGVHPGIYELRVSIKEVKSNKVVQQTSVFGIE